MTQRVNSGCMAPLTCWVNGGQFNALICQISDATGHTLICQLLCCSELPGKQPEYGCYNSTQLVRHLKKISIYLFLQDTFYKKLGPYFLKKNSEV